MVNNIISRRKSIKSFQPVELGDEIIKSLFEAAALAPSSHNEQPWVFILAKRKNKKEFENMLSVMLEKNSAWAKNASLIVLAVGKKNFSVYNKPNKYFMYDVSSAVSNLTMQASSIGVIVHQIGGFDSDKAKEIFNIPEEYAPVVMLAIGVKNELDTEYMYMLKERKTVDQFVFENQFGKQAELSSELIDLKNIMRQ